MSKTARYQDDYFTYIWKPADIPTTFGKQKSFLEQLLVSEEQDIQNIFQRQQEFFTKEEEYGLLNRLDTPTSGLLTFAKTPHISQKYKELQAKNNIDKIYLAQVQGRFPYKEFTITSPIAHSKTSSVRMLVLDPTLPPFKLQRLLKKAKNRKHKVYTRVHLLEYDIQTNTSLLEVRIHKGVRHQIRAHLASIGFPIMGEQLYTSQVGNTTNLQLYCMGMEIE